MARDTGVIMVVKSVNTLVISGTSQKYLNIIKSCKLIYSKILTFQMVLCDISEMHHSFSNKQI